MPINYKLYPANWKELRKQVLERAKHCCEWEGCGLANYSEGYWDQTGKWWTWKEIEDALEVHGYDVFDHELKHKINKDFTAKPLTKVVLTVAHLDHDEENHEVKIDRLRAWCQYHHLNYDKDEKKARRKKKKKQTELFL